MNNCHRVPAYPTQYRLRYVVRVCVCVFVKSSWTLSDVYGLSFFTNLPDAYQPRRTVFGSHVRRGQYPVRRRVWLTGTRGISRIRNFTASRERPLRRCPAGRGNRVFAKNTAVPTVFFLASVERSSEFGTDGDPFQSNRFPRSRSFSNFSLLPRNVRIPLIVPRIDIINPPSSPLNIPRKEIAIAALSRTEPILDCDGAPPTFVP